VTRRTEALTDEVYEYIDTGCLLSKTTLPESFKFAWESCSPETFALQQTVEVY